MVTIVTMSTRVGIAELKAHLSEYVARAKAGERIVVCDRNTPVAELRALGSTLPIQHATRPASDLLKIKPVKLKFPVDVVALLREDRDKR